jgi:fermentation-respiration switch protein FrsA (DUF1100 family)
MWRWFEHHQVYHPDRVMIATGAELGRPFEELSLKTTDRVELHAWFYPVNKSSPRGELVALVCHGNAGNISHRLELCATLLGIGLNVLLFDYRGYGRSGGRASEEGTYLDAEAAYNWLLQRGFAARNVILFGESLGGGIATELAIRKPIGGLVLESTFSCILDVAAEIFPWLPVRWLSTIKYDNCAKLPRVKVPVLLLHSRGDKMIGFHHAEKNYSLANQPKILCELVGDHNEPFTDKNRFLEGMEKFLQLVEQHASTKG